MRRQTRSFTVEVKQKRRYKKAARSIWGDFDIAAAMGETSEELQKVQLSNRQLVDSTVVALDAEPLHKPQMENFMANRLEAETPVIPTEPAAEAEKSKSRARTPRSRKPTAEPSAAGRKNGAKPTSATTEAPPSARTGRKVYSVKERGQKLAQIETLIGGGATLKSAVKQAGISEQTYYLWKKAATPAADSDELKDLVALEEENKRLKSLLADRLRKENTELKKRLGLD
ncbi:transposase [Mesorhizobium sp. VK23B]|uniref:Transposase n=1 Tax=Mesorhizobium dulcispinae TaxID=3072316 RepID=A0ABU4XNN0_9HYPH|nr:MULTISPECIES: transposase [unclassified Mesorhizobium]MDX8470017.1 transposase [Mesorhizobium sp. VK23B]MDX8476356.1 transposase [Mesorhizobium sp. VK23A]